MFTLRIGSDWQPTSGIKFRGVVIGGSDFSLQLWKYGFYRLQNLRNCLTTVYSFTFLSSTVYEQKSDSILQSTGLK